MRHPSPLPPPRAAPQTVASDLSPFYLAKARDNILDWKAKRRPSADLGAGPGRAGTTFMQCAAESIPAPDETFDVVGVPRGWARHLIGCGAASGPPRGRRCEGSVRLAKAARSAERTHARHCARPGRRSPRRPRLPSPPLPGVLRLPVP
jgi:hypothetical protein